MHAVVGEERPESGALRQAISDLAVRVFADHLERGPTKVRTVLDGDIVLCLLEETMTWAERKLVAAGREAPAMSMRTELQETMRAPLIEGVEELTGRRVAGFVSGNNLAPDLTSELFVLGEPRR
jgi:uncharacterized protein YbcI